MHLVLADARVQEMLTRLLSAGLLQLPLRLPLGRLMQALLLPLQLLVCRMRVLVCCSCCHQAVRRISRKGV